MKLLNNYLIVESEAGLNNLVNKLSNEYGVEVSSRFLDKLKENFPSNKWVLYFKWYFYEKHEYKEYALSIRSLLKMHEYIESRKVAIKKLERDLFSYDRFGELYDELENIEYVIEYNKYISELASTQKNILRNIDFSLKYKLLNKFKTLERKKILDQFYAVSSRYKTFDDIVESIDLLIEQNNDVVLLKRDIIENPNVEIVYESPEQFLVKSLNQEGFKFLTCNTTWCIRQLGTNYQNYSNKETNVFYQLYETPDTKTIKNFHGIFVTPEGEVAYSFDRKNQDSKEEITPIINKLL